MLEITILGATVANRPSFNRSCRMMPLLSLAAASADLDALDQALARSHGPHPNPSPEGARLKAVEARKLLGISLEGSVG